MRNRAHQPLHRLCLLLLCLAIGISSCQPAGDSGPIGASVDNVLNDPNAYYGSRLTVSGSVEDVITPTLFTIFGREPGQSLLVASVDSIAPAQSRSKTEPVRQADLVQVTGQLRRFNLRDFEDEWGLDLGDAESDFEGQPVIVARNASATLSSVVVTPKTSRSVTPPGEASLVTDFAASTADDADELSGEAAHFRDLTVARVIDERSFWARQGNDSLFVVLVSGALDTAHSDEDIQEGQIWEIYGLLRAVPSATVLTEDWGVSQETVRSLENERLYLLGIYAATGR